MKLLFIVSVPSQEGSNLSLLNLITALRNEGHECGLLASRDGFLIDKLSSLGVKCGVIRYRAALYPLSRTVKDILYYIPSLLLLLENIINYKQVRHFVEDFSPDIIHTNVSTINVGYKVAKELKIPHVWHIREYMDLDFNIHPFPTMESRKKQLADSYTISITKDIRRHFGLERNDKANVIYNGIMKSSEVHFDGNKQPVFLYAAFLQQCKGVYDLLNAFANHIIQRPNSPYKLRLLGGYTPDVYEKVIRFIKENGIDNKVEVMGKVSPETVCRNLRTASVTFIPSFSEGFGRTTAEAMFNGCLVAGRNTGGTKEQFDNGISATGCEIGLRFDTVGDMTSIMNEISDRGTSGYNKMIMSSQKVVADLYSIETNVEQTLKLYKKILDERS